MPKKRADQLLVETGLCDDLEQARRCIMAGLVRVGADHVVKKPADTLAGGADLRVVPRGEFVSRGAFKLLPALDRFLPVLPENTVALDLGASTGGFSDLLLQRGAVRVYAVDSGYGQLHYRLRRDPRVIVMERTNARYLDSDAIPEKVHVLTADLSFIAVQKVLARCAGFLRDGGWAFVLVKPQFQARRDEIEPGGVVRDESVRQRCVSDICSFGTEACGWRKIGVVESPITGPAGNREYVAVFRNPPSGAS